MSSLRRTISSRANGARSRGPVTPTGKLRSSRNATRHGLLVKCAVFENESRQGVDSLHSEFVARFGPTAGFTSIAAQPPLELMHRYGTRLHRIFQRALANLIRMRSLQEPDPPESIKLQNESG